MQYIKGLVISVPKCENISLHIQLRVKWVRASYFKNCIYTFEIVIILLVYSANINPNPTDFDAV